MGLKKAVSLCLVALLLSVSALSYLAAVNAELSLSKPSVPEFALSFEWHSSDKPAVYDTDPYTGQQRELQAAQHYEWGTITVTIKNQQITSSQANDGDTPQNVGLYYSIRTKGHFAEQ